MVPKLNSSGIVLQPMNGAPGEIRDSKRTKKIMVEHI